MGRMRDSEHSARFLQTEYIQYPQCLGKIRWEEGGGGPPTAVRHVSQNFSRFGLQFLISNIEYNLYS